MSITPGPWTLTMGRARYRPRMSIHGAEGRLVGVLESGCTSPEDARAIAEVPDSLEWTDKVLPLLDYLAGCGNNDAAALYREGRERLERIKGAES